jgi:peptidoglycan/LPS O-acetylase OafA/YrhL
VGLGLFSYSIYLIHSPLLAWLNLATLHIEMPAGAHLAVIAGLGIPMAVAASYVFYLVVERRFMSGHMARVTKT